MYTNKTQPLDLMGHGWTGRVVCKHTHTRAHTPVSFQMVRICEVIVLELVWIRWSGLAHRRCGQSLPESYRDLPWRHSARLHRRHGPFPVWHVQCTRRDHTPQHVDCNDVKLSDTNPGQSFSTDILFISISTIKAWCFDSHSSATRWHSTRFKQSYDSDLIRVGDRTYI